MPIIQTLGRMKQKDHEFKASLGYVARPYLKTNKRANKKNTDLRVKPI
jgi:hypothetical protein